MMNVRKFHIGRVVLACFSFLVLLTPVLAQANLESAVYLQGSNVVYRWSDASNQFEEISVCNLTADAPITGLLQLSPDGRYMAATVAPEQWAATREEIGGVGGGPLPNDVWLCDLQTGVGSFIASQPETASFAQRDDGGNAIPDYYFAHSDPTWVGNDKIAWTKLEYFDGEVVEIYDLPSQQTTRVTIDLLPNYGVPAPSLIVAGDREMYVLNNPFDQESGTVSQILHLLDASGTPLAVFPFELTDTEATSNFVDNFRVVRSEEVQFLVGFLEGQGWLRGNPFTASTELLGDAVTLELRNRNNPWGVFARVLRAEDSRGVGGFQLMNIAEAPDEIFPFNKFAVSADGRVFYVDDEGDDRVLMWDGREFIELPAPGERKFYFQILASGAEWHLGDGEAPVARVFCDNATESQLAPGMEAVMVDSVSNNIRALPSRDAAIIGSLPTNAELTILQGPNCVDDLAWYQIEYNGTIGWTVEGADGVYWIVQQDN